MSVLAKRLKDARLGSGFSQEQLGINAGLDEMSASTRMNRYELGKRVPDFSLVERFSAVLNVPTAYFYAIEEDEAQVLLKYHRLDKKQRHLVLDFLNGLSN